MKSKTRLLSLSVLLGTVMMAHAAPVLFPNGDFETPAGDLWGTASAGAQVFNFPAAGGNPGGYAEIVSSEGGGYAVLISNSDQPYPLASLGLVAGSTYTFSYEMSASATGANKGGIKIESWSASSQLSNSGDQRVTVNAAGWNTYTYQYTINPAATHLKLVPLWTPNETVGFDNFRVDDTPVVPPPVVPVVPNGEFTTPGGAQWAFFSNGPSVSYPSSGGNPDGHAIIDSTVNPGTFGVMVSNNNAPLTLASLGLTAGETYQFQMDMKLLAGSQLGGLKVEFVPTSSGDLRPTPGEIAALPNPVTDWNTYTFSITLPPACTQILLVPLWGPNSQVAYDNFKILLPAPPAPLAATIRPGSAVSWTPTVAENTYQPQRSDDGITFSNFGPAFTGTSVSSAFDADSKPFHQVLESTSATVNAILNGGFEEDDGFEETFADLWGHVQSQPPVRILSDFHSGIASMQIKVENNPVDPAPANGSEIQQNIASSGGSIIAGNTYSFSFWAKQVSSGPSYVQRYRVVWLNGPAEVGSGGFQDFAGTVGVWEQKVQNGLVAPANATSALIQILGVTGAVAGGFGEVLIDDVALVTNGSGSSSVIAATSVPAVEVSWPSVAGVNYQVRSSTDLQGWTNLGPVVAGNDTVKSVFEALAPPRKFFSVVELP